MYESWFRFRRRPFITAPRVDDYYPAETSEAARKTLIACIERGAGPGLLVGPAGSGKTTLCHQLLTHFRTRTSVGLLACSGLTTRRAFLQSVLFELGQPYRNLDEGEIRLSLIDHLTSRDAGTAGTVLVLDDAHHLAEDLFEDVRMLSNLVRDGYWCIHLVLAGSVQLEETLALPKMESLNQRLAARCYLEAFRGHESEAYVRQQVQRVGGDPDQVFDRGALRAIHDSTSGVPRLINQLCDHALVMAAAGSCERLDAQGICEAWSDLQHLPPPQREMTPTQANENVIEFGVLDGDPIETDQHQPDGLTEQAEEQGIASAADDEDCQSESTEFSPRPHIEISFNDASSDAEPNDLDVPATPVAASSQVANDADEQSADLAMAIGGQGREETPGDVGSQLDDIQRQLEEVDDEVATLPMSDEAQEAAPEVAVNPFLEHFADEEVIVDQPGSMLNRLMNGQPSVVSEEGQELALMLEQSSNRRSETESVPTEADAKKSDSQSDLPAIANICDEDEDDDREATQPTEAAQAADGQDLRYVLGVDFDDKSTSSVEEIATQVPLVVSDGSDQHEVISASEEDEARGGEVDRASRSNLSDHGLATQTSVSVISRPAVAGEALARESMATDVNGNVPAGEERGQEHAHRSTEAVAADNHAKNTQRKGHQFRNLFTRLARD